MTQHSRVARVLLTFIWLALSLSFFGSKASFAQVNGVMMQYFEWDTHSGGEHWNNLANDANYLADMGITAVWLPPPSKGNSKIWDVGYGIYDPYDLGEFKQKGVVRTKYGTKAELQYAIQRLQSYGLQVYSDIVMNHLMGADSTERVRASLVAEDNKNWQTSEMLSLDLYTRFQYTARAGKYSNFSFHQHHFNGVGCSVAFRPGNICKIDGHNWNWELDGEAGNADFLMGANLDYDHPDVVREMKNWGTWLTRELNLNGYRIDAVKHIKFSFIRDWLAHQRAVTTRPLFAVGEYLSGDLGKLENYLAKTDYSLSLFDFPLYYNFQRAASSGGQFDLRTLLDGSLLQKHPNLAVTFVENHDTQKGRENTEGLLPWFKPAAYAFILTRDQGYPSLFYGDFYGQPTQKLAPQREALEPLLRVRKAAAYGEQHNYFDDPDLIGWTRSGLADRSYSGLAALITDRNGGQKRMWVGLEHAGETWVNVLEQGTQSLKISADGYGTFWVAPGSASVWVDQRLYQSWMIERSKTMSLEFIIRHPGLSAEEEIRVTGSARELGSWQTALAPEPSREAQESRFTLNVAKGQEIAFKAFKINRATGKIVKWNEGQDYSYTSLGRDQDQVMIQWKDKVEFVE